MRSPTCLLESRVYSSKNLRSTVQKDFYNTICQSDSCAAAKTTHSITSSVRANRFDGTSIPSALAVFKLITNSNFVDCTTGKSAGFSPLRIRAGVATG